MNVHSQRSPEKQNSQEIYWDIYIYTHTHNHIYIYVYLERERRGVSRKQRAEWGGKREHYFKRLAHVIVGASKFETHTAGQWAGNSDKSWCCSLESQFHVANEQTNKQKQARFLCCSLDKTSFSRNLSLCS